MKKYKTEDFIETYLVDEINNWIIEDRFTDNFNSDKYLEYVQIKADELNITLIDVNDWDYDSYFSYPINL